jgi:hypothetical protein
MAPVTFLMFFLLFFFNGFTTAHFAVGHSIWVGYFLMPFFLYLALDLVERGNAGWGWTLGMTLLLLAILLQGFFHLYLWCLMYLGLLALFNLRLIVPVARTGFFAVLLGLPRLLPPSLALSQITQDYLGGFATVTELVFNLFMMRDPDRAVQLPSKILPLNWWEQDFFVGFIGFIVLVIFGIALPILRRNEVLSKSPERIRPHVQILLASLVFAALSVGQVYAWIMRFIPVPPFTGERVTSRLFILPLVFVLALAAIYLQRELERRRVSTGLQVMALGFVFLLYHDLNQHLQAWRVRYLDGLVYLFPKVPFDAAAHTIRNHADPVYTNLLIGGLIAAVAAFFFLLFMALRERRSMPGG